MAIKNQVGRTTFDLAPPEWLEGLVLEGQALGWPLPYPERREIWSVVFSGDPGDGTYGATLHGPLGESVLVEIEREAGVPATNTLLAEAWAAAVLADPDAIDLVSDAVATTGTVAVSFRMPGQTYSIDGETAPAAVAQNSVVTITGNDAGLYRIALQVDGEASQNIDFTATVESIDGIQDGLLAAAALLDPAPAVTISGISTNQIEFESDVAGVGFTLTLTQGDGNLEQATDPDNVSADVAATQTQAPNGGAIAFGRFVVRTVIDGKSAVRLPDAGDVAGDIVGVTARTHATLPRPANPTIDDEPTYLPGSTLTPIERVDAIVLRNVGNVAAVVGGAVYAVVDDSTDDFGQARADADGGNAVAPTRFTAKWLTETAAGALGLVSLR